MKTKRNRGFTLVELMVVVSIIAVLVALLFPAIKTALLKAEVASSQTKAQALVTAITAWNTTYGVWPIVSSTTQVPVDDNFVKLLTGQIASSGSPSVIGNNPSQIKFLDIGKKDLDSSGNYIDAWQNIYQVVVDQTYGSQMKNILATSTTYQANICVFSAGPDHQWDQRGLTDTTNADNIVVWK